MLIYESNYLSNYTIKVFSQILLRKLKKHEKFDNNDYIVLKMILENLLNKEK